jgi:hypothetical protein
MKSFNQMIANIRIADLGHHVSFELPKETISFGMQFQDAGKCGERCNGRSCRGQQLLFPWHIYTR